MARFYLVGFLILVVFDTIAQIGFKFAADGASPLSFDVNWLMRVVGSQWVYCSVLGYIGAFFTWMTLLKHAPIGPAFAASHLEIVTVLVVSVLWLGESLTTGQVAGSLLIVGGIALLGRAEVEQERKIASAAETSNLEVANQESATPVVVGSKSNENW